MLIDTDKISELIQGSDMTGYKIQKLTNVKQVSYDRFRNGDAPVDNMPIKTAKEIMKVANLTYPSRFQIITKLDDKLDVVENFNSFAELKLNLISTDYFGWLLNVIPDVTMPDFSYATTFEDIQRIIEPYQYEFWTIEVVFNEKIFF